MHIASWGVIYGLIWAWFIFIMRSWGSWNTARFAWVNSIIRSNIRIHSLLSLTCEIVHSWVLMNHSISSLNLIPWSHLIPSILWAWCPLRSHYIFLMLSIFGWMQGVWIGTCWSYRGLTMSIWIWNLLTFHDIFIFRFLPVKIWWCCWTAIVVFNAWLGRYLRNLLSMHSWTMRDEGTFDCQLSLSILLGLSTINLATDVSRFDIREKSWINWSLYIIFLTLWRSCEWLILSLTHTCLAQILCEVCWILWPRI